jgi:hypothetical protein
MKFFVADIAPFGQRSDEDFHWVKSGEILIYPFFQKHNDNSLLGISSLKFTTHITVKTIDIPEQFFKELVYTSFCEMQEKKELEFSEIEEINNICKDLLEKASCFNDGDKVVVYGKRFFLVHKNNLGNNIETNAQHERETNGD